LLTVASSTSVPKVSLPTTTTKDMRLLAALANTCHLLYVHSY